MTNIFKHHINSTRYYSTGTILQLATVVQLIKNHNQKILNEFNEADITPRMCNCRNKVLCSLDGEGLTTTVMLSTKPLFPHRKRLHAWAWQKAISKSDTNNHKLSFNDRKHSHATVLSKHVHLLIKEQQHNLHSQMAHHCNTTTYAYSRNSALYPPIPLLC